MKSCLRSASSAAGYFERSLRWISLISTSRDLERRGGGRGGTDSGGKGETYPGLELGDDALSLPLRGRLCLLQPQVDLSDLNLKGFAH